MNQKFNYVKKTIGIIMFLFLCMTSANSQQNSDQFIKILSKNREKDLKKDFINVLKKVKNESKSYEFIEFGKIEESLINGKILFSLSGFPSLSIKLNKLDFYNENNFLLLGDIIGENVGFIQLLADSSGVFGQLEINEKSYEIIGLGSRKLSLLVESKKDKQIGCGMDIITDYDLDNDKLEHREPKTQDRSLPCNSVNSIWVLIVYTQNAIAAAGNVSVISNRVFNAVAGFNQANSVSGVTSNLANIEVAGFEQTTYNELFVGQNITTQAQLDNIFLNLRTATSLRKAQTNADVVICVSDHNHPNSGGWANAISATSDNQTYAVFDIDFLPAQPVFQHELGHLLGGRHADDAAPGDSHAFQYDFKPCWLCSRVFRGTIMNGPLQANVQRPNRWSNPNITDEGVATGTVVTQNVARNISVNATTISNIRPNTTLHSVIYGPSNVTTIGNYTYTVDFGCSNNHTFQWFTSSNGINYVQVGTNISYSTYIYPGTSNPFYVRCIVTGGDGQRSISNFITNVNIQFNRTIDIGDFSSPVEIQPNPSIDETAISFTSDKVKNIELIIMNQSGLVVQKHKVTTLNGLNSFNIKTTDLKPGVYTIHANEGDLIKTGKFIKI